MTHPHVGSLWSALALALVGPAGLFAAELTFKSLDYPNARETKPTGIDAKGIAGSYVDGSYIWRGFYLDDSGFKPVGKPDSWQIIVSGTSGGNVVGRYQYVIDPQVIDPVRAFFWNGVALTDLIPPDSVSDVYAVGISGNLVTGYYRDAATYIHGFLWNGSSYRSFDALGSPGTWPRAISGTHVAGDYVEVHGGAGISRGFFWDGSTFTAVNPPDSDGTWVAGLHGSDVVGLFNQSGVSHGFLWNGSAFVTIDPPGSTQTQITAVYGGRVVGAYNDGTASEGYPTRGFLWDGSSYTLLDVPGATLTRPTGIWEDRIIGQYKDAQGKLRGFVTVIPEPTLVLSVGSTNVFAGKDSMVPLRIAAGIHLTNATVILEASALWLTNMVFQPTGPEVVESSLVPLTADRMRLRLALDPGLAHAGEHEVGRIGFKTISNGHSAVVPLILSQPLGTWIGEKSVTKTHVNSGLVVILDGAPILTVGNPPWMSVVIYGYPGIRYDLQSTENLFTQEWKTVTTVTLTDPWFPIDGLGLGTPATFYRAKVH